MSRAAVEIKGWCPGALRPMQSGDGLLVRIKPRGASLRVAALDILADAAARFGNGQIDLTRRANLQLRGVSPQTFAPLLEVLASLDLLDASADSEAIRNIMVNPLAGLDPDEIVDVRPIAHALEMELAAEDRLTTLPSKFGFALDGGGVLQLDSSDADIHLVAVREQQEARIAIGIGGADGVDWLGSAKPADAMAAAVRVAHLILTHAPTGRAAALSPQAREAIRQALSSFPGDAPASNPESRNPRFSPRGLPRNDKTTNKHQRRGVIALANGRWAVGLGTAFGRLDSQALAALARELHRVSVAEIRLSPWRTIYASLESRSVAERLVVAGQAMGLIVDDFDPLVRIDACSGAGCCDASSLPTRDHARILADIAARTDFAGTIHISGCAKGCARSAPADLVLVGDAKLYRIVRNGTVKDVPSGILDPAEMARLGHALLIDDRKFDV